MTLLVDQEYTGISRMKIIPFQTSSLTNEEFLAGKHGSRKVSIAGELRVPQASQEKLPVVVLVHGSNGAGAREDGWSGILNAQGIATFTLDCFSGRGIDTTASDQAQLGRLTMIADIYRAVELLARQKEIDPQRIVIMGFSRGAQAALYASLTRFHDLHSSKHMHIAGYIAFYPDCSTRYVDDERVDAKPIRIHHGTADDYNRLKPCEAYVERLRAAGADIMLATYPGAHHVFDTPNPAPPKFSPTAQTVRNCALRETRENKIVNSVTGNPFTYDDPCVERETTTGRDAHARRDAIENVKTFLAKLFAGMATSC